MAQTLACAAVQFFMECSGQQWFLEAMRKCGCGGNDQWEEQVLAGLQDIGKKGEAQKQCLKILIEQQSVGPVVAALEYFKGKLDEQSEYLKQVVGDTKEVVQNSVVDGLERQHRLLRIAEGCQGHLQQLVGNREMAADARKLQLEFQVRAISILHDSQESLEAVAEQSWDMKKSMLESVVQLRKCSQCLQLLFDSLGARVGRGGGPQPQSARHPWHSHAW